MYRISKSTKLAKQSDGPLISAAVGKKLELLPAKLSHKLNHKLSGYHSPTLWRQGRRLRMLEAELYG
jgi:hypothetical protein